MYVEWCVVRLFEESGLGEHHLSQLLHVLCRLSIGSRIPYNIIQLLCPQRSICLALSNQPSGQLKGATSTLRHLAAEHEGQKWARCQTSGDLGPRRGAADPRAVLNRKSFAANKTPCSAEEIRIHVSHLGIQAPIRTTGLPWACDKKKVIRMAPVQGCRGYRQLNAYLQGFLELIRGQSAREIIKWQMQMIL